MKRAIVFVAGLIVGGSALAQDAPINFQTQIAPILNEHCVRCHGATKKLADLQLHSLEAVQGLVDQGMIVPGDPDLSELLTRVTLEPDDPMLMPKEGPPLAPEQIELIAKWIKQGHDFPSEEAEAEDEIKHPVEATDAPSQHDLRPTQPAPAEAIEAAMRAGALVMPIFSGSDELRVSFPSSGTKVDESTLRQLEGLAPALVELDLSMAKVTDDIAPLVSKFQYLRRLHLNQTSVGDKVAGEIAKIPAIEIVNLYGTRVTDAGLLRLASCPRLKRVFVWQTAVTFEAAKTLEEAIPGLDVNLGWSHPAEVRERLKRELAAATQKKEAALAEIAKAEATIESAKAVQQSAETMELELKQELEELDSTGND